MTIRATKIISTTITNPNVATNFFGKSDTFLSNKAMNIMVTNSNIPTVSTIPINILNNMISPFLYNTMWLNLIRHTYLEVSKTPVITAPLLARIQ